MLVVPGPPAAPRPAVMAPAASSPLAVMPLVVAPAVTVPLRHLAAPPLTASAVSVGLVAPVVGSRSMAVVVAAVTAVARVEPPIRSCLAAHQRISPTPERLVVVVEEVQASVVAVAAWKVVAVVVTAVVVAQLTAAAAGPVLPEAPPQVHR